MGNQISNPFMTLENTIKALRTDMKNNNNNAMIALQENINQHQPLDLLPDVFTEVVVIIMVILLVIIMVLLYTLYRRVRLIEQNELEHDKQIKEQFNRMAVKRVMYRNRAHPDEVVIE